MQLKQTKKLIFLELVLLLLCLVLLVTSSYAWISISRVPEIIGIDTNVGSNGSLEIALLDSETYLDPSLIRTTPGDSAVILDSMESNLSWGNLVNLSDPGYGLSEITLYPTRLNVAADQEHGDVVLNDMLIVPTYGEDGRTNGINAGTVSAVFSEEKFVFNSEQQEYGVRGIGTIPGMSPQQTALATARSSVAAQISACSASAESAWKTNGAALLGIYGKRYTDGSSTFTDGDVAVIRDTASRMFDALGYVDSAMRQGIIGYAASVIENTDDFNTLRSAVGNTSIPLSMILKSVSVGMPSGFSGWINRAEQDRLDMMQIVKTCEAMSGGSYTWDVIEPMLKELLDSNNAYLGEHKLSSGAAYENMVVDMALTLGPNSGTMAGIADYCGNYNVFFSYNADAGVEVITNSMASTPYLEQVSNVLQSCEAASGDSEQRVAELDVLYGYAVDLAFRCNTKSDLLLQTEEALRVRDDSEFVNTQGGGSYMRLTCEDMTSDQIVLMMDAVRIAFLDQQSRILAVAKLNTSNHEVSEEGVIASLYLYEYAASSGGMMYMGERRAENNVITPLTKNAATVITAVVWLDGDYVGNDMAGYKGVPMEGVLNLQFSSSADLISSDQPISDDT